MFGSEAGVFMVTDRRSFLKCALAGYAAARISVKMGAAQNVPPYAKTGSKPARVDYKRIAKEERDCRTCSTGSTTCMKTPDTPS